MCICVPLICLTVGGQASSGKTDILPAAPASEAAPEQEADAQDQSEVPFLPVHNETVLMTF